MSLNPHLAEKFTPEDIRAGLTLQLVTHLDIKYPDPSREDDPEYLVTFWRDELERWQLEYYRLTEEIDRYSPYRSTDVMHAMREELAPIAANVVEASVALTSSLRLDKPTGFVGGWSVHMYGDCEYHVATVAGGEIVAHVTQNDAGEWVAFRGSVHAGEVIGSGYASAWEAKKAAMQ